MKTFIVANWKCNPITLREAELLFSSVRDGIKSKEDVEIVICPPFVYLPALSRDSQSLTSGGSSFARRKASFGGLAFGSQNCFWEEKGAFTGEISPLMLKDLGCQYVILGHSERRKYFSETDEMINKKLKATFDAKLTPILCIGETQEERNQGKNEEILKNQLQKALYKATSYKLQATSFVVAYEPIWAIGTGNACSPGEVEKTAVFIRKILTGLYDQNIAEQIPILYGGSVNSQNAQKYIKEANLQGLLVGGASLKADEFIGITKIATEE